MLKLFGTIAGSRLYGTSTPKSDTDYQGIYLSPRHEAYGLWPHTKPVTHKTATEGTANSATDRDETWNDLGVFCRQLAQGQTWAMEMLFSPCSASFSPEGDVARREIVKNSQLFLSKELLFPFIGFARHMADKYANRAANLVELREFRNALATVHDKLTYLDAWKADLVPHSGPSLARWAPRVSPDGYPLVYVAGRRFDQGSLVSTILQQVDKVIDGFGARVNTAAGSPGLRDYKSLSHSYRVACQARSILKYGKIVFPLAEAKEILEMKQGLWGPDFDYSAHLDGLIEELHELRDQSSLPDRSDRDKINDFYLNLSDTLYSMAEKK